MMEQRLIDANALKGFLRESYNSLKKIYDGLEYVLLFSLLLP